MKLPFLWHGVCLTLVFGAQTARAEETTPAGRAQAVALFDAATALAQKGRYAEACPKFAESSRLDRQLGVALAGGVALVLTAPRARTQDKSGGLRLAPWLSGGGGGMLATRSF